MAFLAITAINFHSGGFTITTFGLKGIAKVKYEKKPNDIAYFLLFSKYGT